jgi:preprotein translocase subunit SecD
MVDAALQYFVAVRLKDKGASQLARATTQAVGRQLTLMVGDRFLGGALIDAPIEQGVFALPMQDQAAAFALAQLLNPPPY